MSHGLKQFFSRDFYENSDFQRFGQAIVWCLDRAAPQPPVKKTYGGVNTIGRHEKILFDGVLCEARQVEVSADAAKTSTRFLAVRVAV